MQAVAWIKKCFEHTLRVKSMNDDYGKWLEIAIKQGAPFLFEGVQEEIDPMIMPIIDQNYQSKSNIRTVNFNGSETEVHDNFRM